MDTRILSLAKEADFTGNLLGDWQPYQSGYHLETIQRDGQDKTVYAFCNDDFRGGAGLVQVFENPELGTYVGSGWSKADGVVRDDGTENCSYSLAARLTGLDGKITWYQTTYSTGTHDWEFRQFSFTLEHPIARMEFFCMLRDPFTGMVWFDDVMLRRGLPSTVTFGGVPMQVEQLAPQQEERLTLDTRDGLTLGLGDNTVTTLSVDGRSVMSTAYSGFLVRDIAAESDVLAFETADSTRGVHTITGWQPQLGLSLTADFTAHVDHIAVEGVIRDEEHRPEGRCVQLSFALPVDAAGWMWGDNIQCARPIRTGESAAVYRDLGAPIGRHCLKPGSEEMWLTVWDWDSEPRTLSPVASAASDETGLCLAASMEFPQYYILEYNGSTRQYVITFLLGIVPQAPDAARFRFILYKSDAPEWGFRAAMEKYARIYPEAYQVREKDQGLWVAAIDMGKVEGVEDFHFKFKEETIGYYTRPYGEVEKEHGVLGLQYIEPGDWWCRNMTVERNEANIQAWIRGLAAKEDSETTRQATANAICQNHDQNGKLSWYPTDAPWSRNGAQVHINANPALPGKYNFYSVYFCDRMWQKLFHPAEGVPFDGIYLDELSGWWRGNANFNTAHYQYTTVPLTYSPYYKKPMLHRASTTWEFTHKLASELHAMGHHLFANKCPDKDNFYTPLVDGMGTEMTALTGTEYDPQNIDQLSMWRTFSYQKPYCILLSNDCTVFDCEMFDKYFQRCLAFGIFPCPHGDYSDKSPYFAGEKKVYNRDRHIWQKYMPVLRTIANAGWEPVTLAKTAAEGVLLERFGQDAQTGVYLTVYNNTDQVKEVEVELAFPGADGALWELTARQESVASGGIYRATLQPAQTIVLGTKPLSEAL